MTAQVLRATTKTVTAAFDADPGTVTVTITRLDGTAVVTDATTTASDNDRSYPLSAAQTADLDTLSLAFTSDDLGTITETVEVVGALLFTVAEARAFDGGAMQLTSTYPTATIEEARARITDQFETICGVSFVPRYRLDILSGIGTEDLMLPRMKVTDVRSIEYRDSGSTTWTAYDADDLADVYIEDYGWLLRESRGTFVSGRRNIRVGYEHGYATVPLDIKRAALMAVKHELMKSNVDPRAISISDEMTTTQLWTPGISARGSAIHPLPEVDRILKLYMYTVPVVA